MKEVVVAGGSSFIGLHLIQKLAEQGHHVTVFVRCKSDKISRIQDISTNITCIELDLENYDTMGQHLKLCDCYIPLTWEGTKRTDRNNEWMNQNSCHIIFQSIKSMVEEAQCKKIILAGSFSEYGSILGPLTEDLECIPDSEYGKYKLELYQMAKSYCTEHLVSLIEVRLFSVYGCGDGDDKLLNQVIQKLLLGEAVSLTGCEQTWEFIHVRDVVEALILLIKLNTFEGCLNLTTEYHRTLQFYLEATKRIIGQKGTLLYGALDYPNHIVPHIVSDTSKIRNLLNWEPKVCFEDGVKEMIDYYRNSTGRVIEGIEIKTERLKTQSGRM